MKPTLNAKFYLEEPVGATHKYSDQYRRATELYNIQYDRNLPAAHMYRVDSVNTIDIETLIKEIDLSEVKPSDIVIMHHRWEAWQHDGDTIYRHFVKHHPTFNMSQFYVCNEGLENYDTSRYHQLSFCSLDGWCSGTFKQDSHVFENKTHEYLSFNRVNRDHRCLFVAELEKNNLVSNGRLSFVPQAKFYGDVLGTHSRDVIKRCRFIPDYIKPLYNGYAETHYSIDDINPETYRYHDKNQDGRWNAFDTSMFSVVSETFYSERPLFITEKTYGAICQKHAFIINGQPGTLRMLREFGFKTFDSVFDESYDTELDHMQRMHMIINEIKKFISYPAKKKELLWNILNSIAEYNCEHLKNTYHHRKDKNVPHFSANVITLYKKLNEFVIQEK